MAWATREIVYVYCGLQGRAEDAAFCNFDARHLPEDVVDMMDVDARAQDPAAEASAGPLDSDSDEDEESESVW